jgi:hypothetical protein
MVFAVFVATSSKTCRDAALGVEGVHGVEPLAKAARRHGNHHDMRKFPLDSFLACAAFVASHVRK